MKIMWPPPVFLPPARTMSKPFGIFTFTTITLNSNQSPNSNPYSPVKAKRRFPIKVALTVNLD